MKWGKWENRFVILSERSEPKNLEELDEVNLRITNLTLSTSGLIYF